MTTHRTKHLVFEVVNNEITVIAIETKEANVIYSGEGNKAALFLAPILENEGCLPEGWTENAFYPRVETKGNNNFSLWDNCIKVNLSV